MKKTVSKLLALALTAALVLTGCGGTDSSTTSEGDAQASAENAITDPVFGILATRELQTFNILYSQRSEDFETLTNLFDGLLEVDHEGKLAPCIAESWGTEDGGLTWTFNIREGVKWVNMNGEEMADCTAQDFATGLEWVLNFHKNDSSNTSMPIEMIEGASEYYEYTKTLSEEEAYALTAGEGSKFREMVGLETPDDYTLVYHCTTAKPYFDTLAAYASLYPAPQALIDELGVDGFNAMNNENMWYNGCYTLTSYIQGNEKIFTKNPLYWDTECTLFNTVTFKMIESNDVGFQLYQTGDIDYIALTEANLSTIANDPNHEYYDYLIPSVPSKYAYQFQFNYNKLFEDGTPDTNWNTAIANTAFRKAWYYGLDLTNYFKRSNTIDPMACELNTFTMPGLVYTSDGTEYTDLVEQTLGLNVTGETPARVDADKAAEYKAQAMEELSAQGVTFPVEVDYYISASSQTALDSANVLAQAFSDCLGDDFVKLNIKTYIQSINTEVVTPHLHSFVINGWGADYGDPQNYLGQMVYGADNAYYSNSYNYINEVEETEATADLINAFKEYTALVDAANAITDDMDARYTAYAEAEAYLLDNVLSLPCYQSIGWALGKVDNRTKMNAMFGCCNDKMKNWETNVNGYTSADMGVAEQVQAYTASASSAE